jgi:ribokinase
LARHITTVYNPSPMPTSSQIANEMKWEHIDWLLVNEGEAQQLLDIIPAPLAISKTTTKLPGNVPDSVLHPCELILRLASRPSFRRVNIVCTLGPLGVLAQLPSAPGDTQIIYEPAVLTTKVKDTTGAGDCWTGYLVAGLMKLETISDSELDMDGIRRLLRRCNQVRRCLPDTRTLDLLP